jgi:hypothetical protein
VTTSRGLNHSEAIGQTSLKLPAELGEISDLLAKNEETRYAGER